MAYPTPRSLNDVAIIERALVNLLGTDWLFVQPVAGLPGQKVRLSNLLAYILQYGTADVIYGAAGSQVGLWNSSGFIISSVSPVGGQVSGLTIERVGSVGNIFLRAEGSSVIAAQRFSADTAGPVIRIAKFRGTIASPSFPLVNDIMGNFSYEAWAGSTIAVNTAISLRGTVIEPTPSATALGSRWTVLMPALGSIALTEVPGFDVGTGFSLFGTVVINQNRHFRPRQYASASLPAQNSGDMIASSDIVAGTLVSDGTEWLSPGVLRKRAMSSNGSVSIPAGWAIDHIHFAETAGGAVTGNVRMGTTAGAADIVASQPVGANSIDTIASANILKKVFSRSAAQTVFIQAITSWGTSSVEWSFELRKVF
jgi:hypothetical protein